MRTIKRFELKNLELQHLKLGKTSQILKLSQSVIPGWYYVWATIIEGEPQTTWYKFVIVGSEGSLNDDSLDYVGTLEGPNAPMFHLFYGLDND